MDPIPVARHLVVHGKVQGVFFRDSCREQAERLHVTGWVRNNDDGTVEVRAEGVSRRVDGLISWCHRGPTGAVVADVDVESVEVTGATGFEVR